MNLLDKIKKSVKFKQNLPSPESIQKTREKISYLEKESSANPANSRVLLDLYICHVQVSDTKKKIECLEKLSKLRPRDSYSFQQLADIYCHELDDIEQAKIYQNQANKINHHG